MTPFRLYSFWCSSCSWRVRTALIWKHLSHEIVPVDLGSADGGEQGAPAHLERNPMAHVPVLELQEHGEVRHIGQSLAILAFLEDRYSAFRLLPEDEYLRARARQLAELVNANIQPLQSMGFTKYVRDELGGDARGVARYWVRRGLLGFERTSAATRRRFCVGNEVSWADLCLVPQLYNARQLGVDLDGLEPLVEIESRCLALDAFKRSHPDAQPDAPQNNTASS